MLTATKIEEPLVANCGCWICRKCEGSGAETEDKDCKDCRGSGLLKQCPMHAKEAGWLEKK